MSSKSIVYIYLLFPVLFWPTIWPKMFVGQKFPWHLPTESAVVLKMSVSVSVSTIDCFSFVLLRNL